MPTTYPATLAATATHQSGPPAASSSSLSSSSSSELSQLSSPNRSNRLGAGGGGGGRSARQVSFCAVQIEVAEKASNSLKHIEYNRGKSLEDVFESLAILPPRSVEEGVKAAKHVRGKRQMSDITVTTFDMEQKQQKESTPLSADEAGTDTGCSSSERGEASKPSTKESTPASMGAASSSASSSSAADKDQIKFISGNPFVEVTKGVIHLYKENQTTSLEEGVIRSAMLCMIGVPAKIKTPDLLQFTAPCHDELEMMRVIHDNSPNQYMTLLRFRCQDAADEFYEAFNGQRFNSLESDVCTLVYVSKVETCKESEYYPMAGHTELPVCSICLERMDESVATVLTILCNHTFHGSCLSQWEDSTCPVCRYVQTPEVVAEQRCSDCQSAEDLWICLVCGYVGCGRYVGGHSHAHFVSTQHCYTMELGQNRVWDYVGDNFVHRLVQTDGSDGKLVEAEGNGGLEPGDCNSKTVGGVTVNSDEKLDSIQLEYTYLLTSQLEAQRRYYEEKIERLEEHAHQEMEEVMNRARSSVEESKTMEASLTVVSKEKAKSDQKVSQLSTKLSKLTTELKEEKQLNESLRKNQSEWQAKMTKMEKEMNSSSEEKDKQISDLQEQMRDLMFYLEAQNQIAQSPIADEIKDGQVSVAEGTTPVAGARGRSGGGGKKRRGK